MSAFAPELLDALRHAAQIAVLTGAGISAESGVPTFREAQTGFWAQYDPMTLATPEAFATDPERVWDWYEHRRQLIAAVEPNAGHLALAALQERAEVTIITQNVDGLHQVAGSRTVLELHGSIRRVRCVYDGARYTSWDEGPDRPPKCRSCGSLLRPDIVWFGELLPDAELRAAVAAAVRADLFLSIGTSAVVHPAAGLPLQATAMGVPLCEINLEATPLTPRADWSLRGTAGELLPALLAAAWPA